MVSNEERRFLLNSYNNNNNNNNKNTSICKAHIVSIRAKSEAPKKNTMVLGH